MRRTPRKFEDVVPHTSWFFWDTCCSCNMEFRRERGWSKGYFEWRKRSWRFLCATCAPTREDAVAVYANRPWEISQGLPPAPPAPPPAPNKMTTVIAKVVPNKFEPIDALRLGSSVDVDYHTLDITHPLTKHGEMR